MKLQYLDSVVESCPNLNDEQKEDLKLFFRALLSTIGGCVSAKLVHDTKNETHYQYVYHVGEAIKNSTRVLLERFSMSDFSNTSKIFTALEQEVGILSQQANEDVKTFNAWM